MSRKPAIYNAILENFPTLVIENSRKGPVYETALDELFKLHQQHPEYRDARAKRGMLTIFSVPGDDNELVQSNRRQLLENS